MQTHSDQPSEKFQHKKSLGQHFLNSEYVPKKMCDAGNVEAGDIILEIGPGTGALTKELLTRGATVIAIEADVRAIESLQTTFVDEIAKKSLQIHHTDARNLDFASLGLKTGTFKVIANIPYYLSGLLFRSCLDTEIQPKLIVFLVQKELAERIARAKKSSLLSLSVQVFGLPTYICTVKRGHFTPPPNVDSAIIRVADINKDYFDHFSVESFFTILHEGFKSKRKQLVGNLQDTFARSHIEACLLQTNLEPKIRAEDITLPQWKPLIIQLLSTEKSTE